MNDESGYTVVELIVAIALTFLVTGFTFSSYLFAAKGVSSWRERVETENTFHLMLRRVSDDLFHLQEIVSVSETEYRWTLTSGDTVSYTLRDSTLERDDRPMHGAPMGVSLSFLQQFEQVSVVFALADRRRSFAATIVVAPRSPAGWKPLAR